MAEGRNVVRPPATQTMGLGDRTITIIIEVALIVMTLTLGPFFRLAEEQLLR